MLTAQKMTNLKNSDRLTQSIHARSIYFADNKTASESRQFLPWAAFWVQGAIMGLGVFWGWNGAQWGSHAHEKARRVMGGLGCGAGLDQEARVCGCGALSLVGKGVAWMASWSAMRRPIHAMHGTAMLLPSAL